MSAESLRDREYRHALAALKSAEKAVALWADAVSADVERKLGVSLTDRKRYDDPEYAAALDILGVAQQAVEKMREAAS